jgi:acyl-CoA thioesterase-1
MMRAYTPTASGAASLRVCVIGDSVVAGTGDAAGLGWPGRLEAAMTAEGRDVTVYRLGVRGDATPDLARRWRTEAEPRLPAIFPGALVIAFGWNDVTVRHHDDGSAVRRVGLHETLMAATGMLTAAAAWRPTLAVGPAPVLEGRDGPQLLAGVHARTAASDVDALDAALVGVASNVPVPYLSLSAGASRDARWAVQHASGDGLHPTAAGYAWIAEMVARWDAWRALLPSPVPASGGSA